MASVDKTAEKRMEKPTERRAEKAAEKAAEKPAENAAERPAEVAIERPEEGTTAGTGSGSGYKAIYILAFLLVLLVGYNQMQISSLYSKAALAGGVASLGGTQGSGAIATLSQAAAGVIPTGIPSVYGAELGVSYDDVSANTPQKADTTINKIGSYDNAITLSGDEQQRYIAISSQISCEYCCGAASIITADGRPACGCAHSYAMRGLAKYLIKNHGSEFTNDQILEELGKWKVLFFPTIHVQKAAALEKQGIELNYINLASNKYRGIEKGQTSGGGMVGGC